MIAVLVTLIAPTFTGAVGPSANPPDNSGLVPTFSGLDVTGDAEFETTISVQGDTFLDYLEVYNNTDIDGNLTVNSDTELNGGFGVDYDNDGTNELEVIEEIGAEKTNIFSHFNVDANNDGNDEFQALDWNTATMGGYASGVYIAIENLLGTMLIQATAGLGEITINANDISITGPVDVDGRITADQIGSFYQIYRRQTSSSYSYVNCYTGDILMGCSGRTSSGSLRYAYPVNQLCQASSTSATGSTYAYAICFDLQGGVTGRIDADA